MDYLNFYLWYCNANYGATGSAFNSAVIGIEYNEKEGNVDKISHLKNMLNNMEDETKMRTFSFAFGVLAQAEYVNHPKYHCTDKNPVGVPARKPDENLKEYAIIIAKEENSFLDSMTEKININVPKPNPITACDDIFNEKHSVKINEETTLSENIKIQTEFNNSLKDLYFIGSIKDKRKDDVVVVYALDVNSTSHIYYTSKDGDAYKKIVKELMKYINEILKAGGDIKTQIKKINHLSKEIYKLILTKLYFHSKLRSSVSKEDYKSHLLGLFSGSEYESVEVEAKYNEILFDDKSKSGKVYFGLNFILSMQDLAMKLRIKHLDNYDIVVNLINAIKYCNPFILFHVLSDNKAEDASFLADEHIINNITLFNSIYTDPNGPDNHLYLDKRLLVENTVNISIFNANTGHYTDFDTGGGGNATCSYYRTDYDFYYEEKEDVVNGEVTYWIKSPISHSCWANGRYTKTNELYSTSRIVHSILCPKSYELYPLVTGVSAFEEDFESAKNTIDRIITVVSAYAAVGIHVNVYYSGGGDGLFSQPSKDLGHGDVIKSISPINIILNSMLVGYSMFVRSTVFTSATYFYLNFIRKIKNVCFITGYEKDSFKPDALGPGNYRNLLKVASELEREKNEHFNKLFIVNICNKLNRAKCAVNVQDNDKPEDITIMIYDVFNSSKPITETVLTNFDLSTLEIKIPSAQ